MKTCSICAAPMERSNYGFTYQCNKSHTGIVPKVSTLARFFNWLDARPRRWIVLFAIAILPIVACCVYMATHTTKS